MLEELFEKHHTKTVTALTRQCFNALADRGDLSEVATIARLRNKLREKLDSKFRSDKFLVIVKDAFLIQRMKYDERAVTNFVTNATEPYHLPELRNRFAVEAERQRAKSRSSALSDEQLIVRLAEFIALEDNADLPFLNKKNEPAPPPIEARVIPMLVPSKKQNKMIVANKGLTDIVRIFESLSDARFIEKVNQELITSIFQKRMEDGGTQEWTPNQYSAQKSNAFPSNPDELPPQTSSDLMVNFVNALLNLMSPDAKRKLNRS